MSFDYQLTLYKKTQGALRHDSYVKENIAALMPHRWEVEYLRNVYIISEK